MLTLDYAKKVSYTPRDKEKALQFFFTSFICMFIKLKIYSYYLQVIFSNVETDLKKIEIENSWEA